MTRTDLLVLAALALVSVGLWGVGVLARAFGRALVRMEHHLERRLVDLLLAALTLRWLRRRHARLHRPALLEGDAMYRACQLSAWAGDPMACRWCNGLLPDRSRRFCRPQCSRQARENHVFGGPGGARDAALARDGYRCRGCGTEGSHDHALEVHHRVACHGRHGQPGCWHHLDGLLTLCSGPNSCHAAETRRQLASGELRPAPWRAS